MVIPLIIRGAGMAARGMGAGIKGAGRAAGNIKDKAQQGWEGAQNFYGSAKTRIQNMPGAANVAAGAGLIGALATGKGSEHKHGGTAIIIFAFFLFLADILTEYKGFQIEDIGSVFAIFQLIGSLAYVIGVWALFFWILSRDRSLKTLVTFIIILIIVIISLAFAFKFDPFSIFHVIFILIFWMGFVKPAFEDESRANIFLIAILVIDLYLYSIFNAISPDYAHFLKGFPFLFILTVAYVWQQTRSLLALVFMIGVVGWYFLLGGPQFAEKLNLTGIGIVGTVFPPLKDIPQKLIVEPYKKISEGVSAWLSGKIQYAITGKVEENQFEPLGVSLENVQSADPRYYEDEDVIVWGTVKARTLDDPINIKVGCFVKRDDKKILADIIDPNKKFSVFTLEEQDFACTFTNRYNKKNKILKDGTNTIKAFADFNFETLAYLKTYFINRERQRAMVMEGLDPFKEFAIEDKNPIAVYTNGPAKIEMGTNNPLVSVSLDYIVKPSLDIRIGNREGWQGRINQLEELVLFLPEGIDFNKDLSCNKKFVEYGIINCEASCVKFVEFECKKVCEGFSNTDEKNRCDNACTERTGTCKKTCKSFFTEGDQVYKGYALDVNDIKYRDESKDFEKGKLFRCRFEPTAMVLGTSPFTTKSFRVKARYNYTVEKDVSVGIDKIPEDKKVPIAIPTPAPVPTPAPAPAPAPVSPTP